MIKDKETFLKQVALMPELKENKLSLVFALHPSIDISNKTKFVDNINSYFVLQKEEDREKFVDLKIDKNRDEIESWLGKDLRINNIKLKSVRGFPDSEIPFGINFLNFENTPQSMIILGSNGSGKSSIYDAIEYNYCKKIGEAQLRTSVPLNYENPVFKDYLSHFDKGFNSCMCEIETVDEKFSLQNLNIPVEVRDKINPETHFISDYDIYHNGQLNYYNGDEGSFHNLIAESLGLSELLQFEKNLRAFISYKRLTETSRINGLERFNKEEKELIVKNQHALEERKQKLYQLIESQNKHEKDNRIQDLQKVFSEIKQNNFDFDFDFQLLLKNIKGFIQKYREFNDLEVKTGNISQINFFTLGIELLKDSTDCPFCNSSVKSTNEIKTYVSEKILEIESFNKLTQELNRTFNYTLENLDNLFNQIALFKGKVTRELNIIKTISEFSGLTSSENSIIAYIESTQATEFYSDGSLINENEKFKVNKNLLLNSYYETHNDYIENELMLFIDNISKFSINRNQILINIEKSLIINSQIKTLIEQEAIFKNEINTIEQQIFTSNKKISNNEDELKTFRELQAVFNAIKEEARIYAKHFHTLFSKEVLQAFAPIKLIVEEVLKKYIQKDKRDVVLEIKMKEEDVDEETGEVLSEIITANIIPNDKQFQPLSVNKYFNTFHYRLFSTMVGISIAMASRINTRINLPLVLDDIFYASDFENRATIERFIEELFEMFEKFTPDIELQLILFTHDQLIFESAIKATSAKNNKTTAFAKLFPFKNAKDKGDYKELLYFIPNYLPFKIMQNTLIEI